MQIREWLLIVVTATFLMYMSETHAKPVLTVLTCPNPIYVEIYNTKNELIGVVGTSDYGAFNLKTAYIYKYKDYVAAAYIAYRDAKEGIIPRFECY